jgi:hypothetical protein
MIVIFRGKHVNPLVTIVGIHDDLGPATARLQDCANQQRYVVHPLVTLPTAHLSTSQTHSVFGASAHASSCAAGRAYTTETRVVPRVLGPDLVKSWLNRPRCVERGLPTDTSGSHHPQTRTVVRLPHRFHKLTASSPPLHRRPCLQLRQRGRWPSPTSYAEPRPWAHSLLLRCQTLRGAGHILATPFARVWRWPNRVTWVGSNGSATTSDTALSLALTKASFRARTSSYYKSIGCSTFKTLARVSMSFHMKRGADAWGCGGGRRGHHAGPCSAKRPTSSEHERHLQHSRPGVHL